MVAEESLDAASLGAALQERLRNDIIFGRLGPSEKLPLAGLRQRYGASVSTLREVLSRLAMEGLVQEEAQRGFFVAPMTAANLKEIADLRIVLESHAFELSFAAGDTEWEGRVVAAHHKLHRMEERMKSGDSDVGEDWKRYDWQFHQALIGACGSTELLLLHGRVFDKYLRYQMRFLTYRGDTSANEHRGLLDAALDRDSTRAAEILRTHISGGLAHALAGVSGDLKLEQGGH